MKDTVWVAIIAAGCFVVACVTGLSALGRDATQVLYLLSAVVPGTIASIAGLRAANKARSSAENAADAAGSAADGAQSAAEHAANTAALQANLRGQLTSLQAQIGNRRSSDSGPFQP